MRSGFLSVLTALGLVLALSPSAQAATFTVDTLIKAIASDNSGQAYVETQLELACACNVTLLTNVNLSNANVGTDDAGSRFIDVAPSTPGYFLLKFGTGNTGNDMFFFKNLDEFTKLVWTNSQLTTAGLPADHVQSISHYAITSNVTSGGTGNDEETTTGRSVPEPALLSLLGVSLATLAYRRRRA